MLKKKDRRKAVNVDQNHIISLNIIYSLMKKVVKSICPYDWIQKLMIN